MKKRLLLILAVGIAFSPSVFAMGLVGTFEKANDASTSGAAACHAGMMLKQYAPVANDGEQKANGKTLAGSAEVIQQQATD